MISISILKYRNNPFASIDADHLRAMLVESYFQGAHLTILTGDSDDKEEKITAYKWDYDKEQWYVSEIDIPDVVICYGTPVTEKHEKLTRLLQKHSTFVSEATCHKFEQYKLISESEFADLNIPTVELNRNNLDNSLEVIKGMLLRYSSIVIKRATSSRGLGLLFIDNSENEWVLDDCKTKIHGDLDFITASTHKKIASRLKYRDYLIQPLINSSIQDRAFDFRVHTQKNRNGEWQITRSYVRLSELSSYLPNTSKGGYQGDIEPFLENYFPKHADAILEKLHSSAIGISQLRNTHAKNQLSELGIDYILDPSSKLWVVEANIFPGAKYHYYPRIATKIGYALFLYKNKEKLNEFQKEL